jgi:hypothetical protein
MYWTARQKMKSAIRAIWTGIEGSMLTPAGVGYFHRHLWELALRVTLEFKKTLSCRTRQWREISVSTRWARAVAETNWVGSGTTMNMASRHGRDDPTCPNDGEELIPRSARPQATDPYSTTRPEPSNILLDADYRRNVVMIKNPMNDKRRTTAVGK